jgi:hypothetical protein
VFDPAYQNVGTEDEVVLDFTLGEGEQGQQGEGPGVWALVDKSGVLPTIRKERWDVVRLDHVLASVHVRGQLITCIADLCQSSRVSAYPTDPHGPPGISRLDRLRAQDTQRRSGRGDVAS